MPTYCHSLVVMVTAWRTTTVWKLLKFETFAGSLKHNLGIRLILLTTNLALSFVLTEIRRAGVSGRRHGGRARWPGLGEGDGPPDGSHVTGQGQSCRGESVCPSFTPLRPFDTIPSSPIPASPLNELDLVKWRGLNSQIFFSACSLKMCDDWFKIGNVTCWSNVTA